MYFDYTEDQARIVAYDEARQTEARFREYEPEQDPAPNNHHDEEED